MEHHPMAVLNFVLPQAESACGGVAWEGKDTWFTKQGQWYAKCWMVLVYFFGFSHVNSTEEGASQSKTNSIDGVLPLSQTTLTWASTMILINTLIKPLQLTS